MHVIPYHKTHYAEIASWLALRDAYRPAIEEMPEIGFLAYDGDEPVAAAFIRRIEGGFGLLDSLVSKPSASSKVRHEGIDAVVEQILTTARKLNIPKLLAYSVDEGTLRRSEKHGFQSLPHKVIVCDLFPKGV